jgi:hypothetical protein
VHALFKGRDRAATAGIVRGKPFNISARTKSAAGASEHNTPNRWISRNARNGLI